MDPSSFAELLAGVSVPVVVMALVTGLVNCFFGYKIFRVMLAIYGFFLGAGAGALLTGVWLEGGGWTAIAAALVAGLVGAVLLAALYYVGVFAVGAGTGAIAVGALGAALETSLPVIAVVVGAIVLGIVALVLQRAILILVTAFGGAWAAAMGGTALVTGSSFVLTDLQRYPPPWQRSIIPLVVWLILGIAGAVLQFRTTGE